MRDATVIVASKETPHAYIDLRVVNHGISMALNGSQCALLPNLNTYAVPSSDGLSQISLCAALAHFSMRLRSATSSATLRRRSYWRGTAKKRNVQPLGGGGHTNSTRANPAETTRASESSRLGSKMSGHARLRVESVEKVENFENMKMGCPGALRVVFWPRQYGGVSSP